MSIDFESILTAIAKRAHDRTKELEEVQQRQKHVLQWVAGLGKAATDREVIESYGAFGTDPLRPTVTLTVAKGASDVSVYCDKAERSREADALPYDVAWTITVESNGQCKSFDGVEEDGLKDLLAYLIETISNIKGKADFVASYTNRRVVSTN